MMCRFEYNFSDLQKYQKKLNFHSLENKSGSYSLKY